MITSKELFSALEDNTTESNVKLIVKNLLQAIRDWPTENLKEPNELISELKLQINSRLTFRNIDKFLKTLQPEKDAWKMESLNSLLEIFDFEKNGKIDEEVELEVLLERITQHIKENF